MTFSQHLARYDWDDLGLQLNGHSAAAAAAAVGRSRFTLDQWQPLLAPAAEPLLPVLAQRAAVVTRQRFGRTIHMFAPLYLSNRCSNICTYCGFSMHNPLRRLTLTSEALQAELQALSAQGFDELLLVTGESERDVGIDYLEAAVVEAKRHFRQVLIEVQPLAEADYRRLVAVGLDGVVVYQESYHRPTYAAVHLKGKKTDFDWRLATAERAAAAGVERIGLGVLLGLADWRRDLFLLAAHLRYLQQHYWRSRYQISLPRLRPCTGGAAVADPVSDRSFAQALCSLRLLAPEVAISLSTREPASLRDQLAPLGVTHMSAGSSTQPGGYADSTPALTQFETSDPRSAATLGERLRQLGLVPVWTDGLALASPFDPAQQPAS